ncbi:MAG: DUF4421 domain-containing protein [Muribaculaceae bacterium]|nr:DUF4421 domain-containing protein [Muribaculaceae bacterium]
MSRIILTFTFAIVCAIATAQTHISGDSNHPLPDNEEIDTLEGFVDSIDLAESEAERDVPDLMRLKIWEDGLRRKIKELKSNEDQYPKFIRFCLKTYRWAEKTFNSYDTTYVGHTGKHGKVRLLLDNWADAYYFRMPNNVSLTIASNPYSNLGIQANYSILSLSYSHDITSWIHGNKSKHKKAGITLWTERVYLDFYHWSHKGQTVIRSISAPKDDTHHHLYYDGLDFSAYGVTGFYFFNYKKFSFPAGYNLSTYQLKSQGSWLAGMITTIYSDKFDLTKLPEGWPEKIEFEYEKYSMRHQTFTLVGGYSYNWVLGKHWHFNVTAAPAIGLTHARYISDNQHHWNSTVGGRVMSSLTYYNRQFFVAANGMFRCHYMLDDHVGFATGIANIQVSTGVRF